MFFFYLVAKAVFYVLAGIFFAAYFVGLVLWVTALALVRVVLYFAGRPAARRDQERRQAVDREHQVATLAAHSGGLDEQGLTPALHGYYVGLH